MSVRGISPRAIVHALKFVGSVIAGLAIIVAFTVLVSFAFATAWVSLLVAIGIAAMFLLVRFRVFGSRAGVVFLALLLAITLLAIFLPGTSRATTNGDTTGGVDQGFLPGSPGHAIGIGSNWVDVWHTGHYPIGAFRDYEFHCRWDFSYGHNKFLAFDARPTVNCYTSHENFVNLPYTLLDGSPVSRIYGCNVLGQWRSHGCFFGKAKVKIMVTLPGKGNLMPVYPWVYVRLDASGDILIADHWRAKLA